MNAALESRGGHSACLSASECTAGFSHLYTRKDIVKTHLLAWEAGER